MAKILLGATIGDIRGKQGGTVYSRNRYTNYTRQKTSPVNPNTIKQSQVRNKFGNISSAWRQLGSNFQQSWINLADQLAPTNVFGNSFKYTGFNVFMLGNQTLQANGITSAVVQAAPPTPPVFQSMEGFEFSTTDTPAMALSMLLSADAKTAYDTQHYQLQCTPVVAQSLGNSSVINLYRNLDLGSDIAVGANDITPAYDAVFGTYDLSIASCIYLRARFVDPASGLYSPWVVYRLDWIQP